MQRIPTLVIAGIGNYKWPMTRHSVGYQVIDHFAACLPVHHYPHFERDRSIHCQVGRVDGLVLPNWIPKERKRKRIEHDGDETKAIPSVSSELPSPQVLEPKFRTNLILLKTELYMNESGKAVQKALRKFGLQPSGLLLLHDDMERGFGKLSMKMRGSANGHNGVADTCARLGTQDFERLRIGIGRPTNRSQVTQFVLDKFASDEQSQLDTTILDSAVGLIDNWIDRKVTGKKRK